MAREQQETTLDRARKALEQLAMAPPSGLAAVVNDSDAPLHDAALVHVTELKRPKGGGLELKLVDRLRALALLMEFERTAADGAAGNLLEALARSAGALNEAQADD